MTSIIFIEELDQFLGISIVLFLFQVFQWRPAIWCRLWMRCK